MKKGFNFAVTFALMSGALFVTSCANDVATDINTDPAGNAITFSPVVGHSTRATETTISNLGNFAVVARGMHHDGVLYDNYLIGTSTEGEIAKRESLIKPGIEGEDPSEGTWKLNRSVYWPSGLDNVLFFAYTTMKYRDNLTYEDKNVLPDGATFGFLSDNPYIKGFVPKKADIKKSESTGIWADGKDQEDLLVAYTQQKRSTSATNVNLNFEHALTQISITAAQSGKLTSDNRIVKIKGAWIVNASAKSDLTTTSTKTTDVGHTMTFSKYWSASDNKNPAKTTYGAFYKDIISLTESASTNLLRSTLMLVPENLEAWNGKDDTQSNGGAYILLLCRVELEHNGTTHTGTDIGEIAIEGTHHYHQLFPVNDTEFDGSEYGFVCVPLSSDWNTNGIGKHYTYNLNICGNGTGAGKYPPTMTDDDVNKLIPSGTKVSVVGSSDEKDLNVITARPTNKNVGDNVLDEPIQFTVTVDGWNVPTNWTPGNGDF